LQRNGHKKDSFDDGNAIHQASAAHESDVRLDAAQSSKMVHDVDAGIDCNERC
jgi:hypothetical protein